MIHSLVIQRTSSKKKKLEFYSYSKFQLIRVDWKFGNLTLKNLKLKKRISKNSNEFMNM